VDGRYDDRLDAVSVEGFEDERRAPTDFRE